MGSDDKNSLHTNFNIIHPKDQRKFRWQHLSSLRRSIAKLHTEMGFSFDYRVLLGLLIALPVALAYYYLLSL